MLKIGLTTFALLLTFQTFSQTKNFIDQPYLETTAQVDSLVVPDRIYLNILISEKDERNRIPLEELENRMAGKLASLGIDVKEQLTLSDLASNFKTYFLKKKDILKNKAYKLKVFDALTAGKVIAGLEEIGISNVSLSRTEYSKIDALKLALKSKAVEKAKNQANSLVKPLNQKVGTALYISDKFQLNQNDFLGRLDEVVVTGYGGTKQEFENIDVEFKPIKVQSEVTIKFAIE